MLLVSMELHYINDSLFLLSCRFVYVPCPHTSDVLCEALLDCLLDWNVDTKLSTITLDNCSTNDALVDLLLGKLQLEKLICSGRLFHMRCCAHILNLIVKDGLDVIKGGIEKIRDSVVYWSATPKREEKFEETTKQLRIPFTKKLVFDCPTRWNSTYLMLEVAIMYKDVFIRLKQRDSKYKTLPTESEWEFAREVCNRLKVFFNVTELFSGTIYPTANLYFPQICEVKLSLNEWLGSPIDVIRNMASSMLEKFEKYWNVVHGIMGVAAVLDPRYKMALLEYYFPQLYGNDSLNEVDKIRQLCYDLVSEYQFKLSSTVGDDDYSLRQLDIAQPAEDRLNGFDLFVRKKKKSRTSSLKTELDHYLDEEVLPRNSDFDILLWWKLNGVKYPTLQAIARDLLAIPVSTVASESAFSTSGRLVSPHRNRLHPKTIEALMCAQNWLLAMERKGNITLLLFNFLSYIGMFACLLYINLFVDEDALSKNDYATIYDDLDTEDRSSGII